MTGIYSVLQMVGIYFGFHPNPFFFIMNLRLSFSKLGIIILPIFGYIVFTWMIGSIMSHGSRPDSITESFTIYLVLMSQTHLIILGLSVYLSIKLWLRYIPRT